MKMVLDRSPLRITQRVVTLNPVGISARGIAEWSLRLSRQSSLQAEKPFGPPKQVGIPQGARQSLRFSDQRGSAWISKSECHFRRANLADSHRSIEGSEPQSNHRLRKSNQSAHPVAHRSGQSNARTD